MANSTQKEIKIDEKSIKTELKAYKDKPYECLFEYIWNSFDANATIVNINYKLPENGFWYIENLEISDNWKGWDFDSNNNTGKFLSSSKSETNSKTKTLPMGKLWRWRFAFIWIAKSLHIFSGKKKITLTHDTKYQQEDIEIETNGTRIQFGDPAPILSSTLVVIEELKKQVLSEFGWFLKQNSLFQIVINWEVINPDDNIKQSQNLTKNDFSDEVKKELDDNFSVEIILWKEKPSEWSSFYFLDNHRNEIFKTSTKLNKKSDNFWHSVYIISDFFSDGDAEEDEVLNKQIDFPEKLKNKIKNKIKSEIKEKLFHLRKPYLVEQSEYLIRDLEWDDLLPNLPEYGIYDSGSYNDLLKTIYIISPSLFTGKDKSERKFICATFAALLSSQDNHLIQIILEQLQDLTDEEKDDLIGILERTTLSNVVKTVKEIDKRLEVIDKLKVLISEYEEETLEVKHIQKILDDNFWIFGEEFRLFSTTEGALKKVLFKYAKEILEIEDPELDTQPTGEVDLFLTKKEEYNGIQKNIIVELKRVSIELKEDKEYAQLKKYCKNILEQNLCNGENQFWEFYLIGKGYDSGIGGLINSVQNHWEKEKGLAFWDKDGRVKIYVRKWSDILEVEWSEKMKFLKEELEIKAKWIEVNAPVEIVNNLIW